MSKELIVGIGLLMGLGIGIPYGIGLSKLWELKKEATFKSPPIIKLPKRMRK